MATGLVRSREEDNYIESRGKRFKLTPSEGNVGTALSLFVRPRPSNNIPFKATNERYFTTPGLRTSTRGTKLPTGSSIKRRRRRLARHMSGIRSTLSMGGDNGSESAPSTSAGQSEPFNPEVTTGRSTLGGNIANIASRVERVRRVVRDPIQNASVIADEIDQGFPNVQQGIAETTDSIYNLATESAPKLKTGLSNLWSSSQPHLNRLRPYYGHIGAAALLGGGLYLAGKAIRNRLSKQPSKPRRRKNGKA